MNRTGLFGNWRRTCETTSTTGPHVRLAQNFGVAKVTTNGTCAASDCATDHRYSAGSGRVEVVSGASFPRVLASVGVFERGAGVPIAGEAVRSLTTMFPRPEIPAPAGRARTQYVPAVGTRTCAT